MAARRFLQITLLAAVLAALALGAPTAASAAPVPTAVPCPPGIPPAERERVDCGLIPVSVYYDRPDPGGVFIAYARIRARTPGPADPILFLAGGPGEKIVEGAAAFVSPRSPQSRLALTRDVIVIDQRGVGRSRPVLECPELQRESAGASLAGLMRAYQRCAVRLRANFTRLSAFNTLNNVRDLDLVRQALGYESVNLYGTSYGARLAQQALRGQPSWVRSVVLASPVPPQANFVSDAPRTFSRALSRTYALCRASRECRTQNPDLARQLDRGLQRLVERPAIVRVRAEGRTLRVPITAPLAASALFQLYYSTDGIAQVPALITALGKGDYRPLVSSGNGSDPMGIPLSQGMQYAFLCQEEAPRLPPPPRAGVQRLPLAARILASTNPVVGQPVTAICPSFGLPPSAGAEFAPFTSDTPALIVTGQLDQITSPAYGRVVARQLPTSTLIEVPGVGHSPLVAIGPCGVTLVRTFLDDPTATPAPRCLVGAGGGER